MIIDVDLCLNPKAAFFLETVKQAAAAKAGLDPKSVNACRIVRRSIDARQKAVKVNLSVRLATGDDTDVAPAAETPVYQNVADSKHSVVIVGAGPAGLFAALRALELGMRPIVLERGLDVDARRLKLAEISKKGIVDPNTNYCFGEGGAGAYSDGKLYTRSKKRGAILPVLSAFYRHGAKEDILIDAHPHIGSDKLPLIIKNIRNTIIDCGGEVHFDTRVEELLIKDGEAVGVRCADGKEFFGPVVLATGHSARDVYRMLKRQNIDLEAKGLAIGCRLEHPRQLIDQLQYHSPEGRGKYLPSAEYSYVCQQDGRGVYSFCMCPGGIIVPSASAPGESVVNGMSPSNRGSRWSNAGMVVEVHPGDIPGFSQHGELEMMALQEDLERKFFAAANETQQAPAQRMKDFVEGKPSAQLNPTSYAPGLLSARIDQLLPPFISSRLRAGLAAFGRKSRGFLTNEATVIGLESRTSSPVRITRKPDTLEAIEIRNLYPAGEGAGYAGGIVSAAVDGRRCIDSLYNSLNTK